jgi:hypothetical protein
MAISKSLNTKIGISANYWTIGYIAYFTTDRVNKKANVRITCYGYLDEQSYLENKEYIDSKEITIEVEKTEIQDLPNLYQKLIEKVEELAGEKI